LLFSFGATLLIIYYNKRFHIRKFYVPVALCPLFVFLWCVKSVILTGYPIFPSSLIVFDFDWTMPQHEVNQTANWIYSWARMPHVDPEIVLNSWSCLKFWLYQAVQDWFFCIPVLSIFCSFLLSCACRLKKVSKCSQSVGVYLILTMSILFWFFTAPAIRFLEFYFGLFRYYYFWI